MRTYTFSNTQIITTTIHGRGSICLEMASASCSSVSLSANQRDILVLLLLFFGMLNSHAQNTLPCATSLVSSDVFARCMNISLATLKSDPTTLFGQDLSQYTQM